MSTVLPAGLDGYDRRFYRVVACRLAAGGPCTTQVELVGDRLVLRLDTTPWHEMALDEPAARALLAALVDGGGAISVRHPHNGVTALDVRRHDGGASLHARNEPRGELTVVFDASQLPQLVMHLEDGAAWLLQPPGPRA